MSHYSFIFFVVMVSDPTALNNAVASLPYTAATQVSLSVLVGHPVFSSASFQAEADQLLKQLIGGFELKYHYQYTL